MAHVNRIKRTLFNTNTFIEIPVGIRKFPIAQTIIDNAIALNILNQLTGNG